MPLDDQIIWKVFFVACLLPVGDNVSKRSDVVEGDNWCTNVWTNRMWLVTSNPQQWNAQKKQIKAQLRCRKQQRMRRSCNTQNFVYNVFQFKRLSLLCVPFCLRHSWSIEKRLFWTFSLSAGDWVSVNYKCGRHIAWQSRGDACAVLEAAERRTAVDQISECRSMCAYTLLGRCERPLSPCACNSKRLARYTLNQTPTVADN